MFSLGRFAGRAAPSLRAALVTPMRPAAPAASLSLRAGLLAAEAPLLAAGRRAGLLGAMRPLARAPGGSPTTLLRRAMTTSAPAAPAEAAATGTGRWSALMGGVPRGSERRAAAYMFTVAGLTFSIIVIGGLTRLTESGLSITDWRPVTGTLPPRSDAEWDAEFAKYRASPEYRLQNHGMSMEDFKYIFWWEWGHRQVGRLIGLAWAAPLAWMAARGTVVLRDAGRMTPFGRQALAIGTLIGAQGLMGWLMVKSGLDERLVEEDRVARVSHLRLAAHLGLALVIYGVSLWNGLSLLPSTAAKNLYSAVRDPAVWGPLRSLKRNSHHLATLVGVTILSGALVAGLHAGRVYNEFPTMGPGRLAPADYLLPVEDEPNPVRRVLDSAPATQFHHRVLATTTLAAGCGLVLGVVLRRQWHLLAKPTRNAMLLLSGALAGQFTLGIATLLMHVPTPLASAHQAGAVVVMSAVLRLMHTLRSVSRKL
ncbi:hypothetical protein H696_03890 [Fonticula alba]|uniref:Cytochrome c oxidase assembly protein subunit 15 n=1 Tax=Fonticula alba TaxID=691883 RepID=A0A058Z5V2_FONAL|nr:hypothetical protein H696_03890 [Fonticula alba]KCV69461.1 hypothetical protein H696_03890 [Fonticula alba]|eukprot:XP_009496026.1 hypothetical protein H696_03890 [Fonticula alba]